MNDIEFKRLLRVSTNGGREEVGGAASELREVVRAMAIRFLLRKKVRTNDDVIHDLVGGALVLLFEKKTLPKDYPWAVWIRTVLVRAWAQYCKETLAVDTFSGDGSPMSLRDPSVSVPMAANARLLRDGAKPLLINRVLGLGPQEEPERTLWEDAVRLLVREGTVRAPDLGSFQSGIPPNEARKVILRAVVQARCAFEEIFGGEEIYTIEECEAARDLAEKLF